jgi:hypothetical protein
LRSFGRKLELGAKKYFRVIKPPRDIYQSFMKYPASPG